MGLYCLIKGHDWSERYIRTTPPDRFIQSPAEATLKECSHCKKQIVTYYDEQYNQGEDEDEN